MKRMSVFSAVLAVLVLGCFFSQSADAGLFRRVVVKKVIKKVSPPYRGGHCDGGSCRCN